MNYNAFCIETACGFPNTYLQKYMYITEMFLLYFEMDMACPPMSYTNISYHRVNGKTFAIARIGKEARFKEINRASHKEHIDHI